MNLRALDVGQRFPGPGTQIHWSSIFSGAFTTLGSGLFFLLLGNAIGLSAFHATASTGALEVWSWIYTAITMIYSFYIGAFVGTRSGEITNATSGELQGVVSWG